MPQTPSLHPIVIAGGGAGGLELAARLGRRFGPERVVLVDQSPFHIWKPSLHEVAAGTLDIHQEGLSYAMLARIGGFSFVPGRIEGIERDARELVLAPLLDPKGEEVFGARRQAYGQLVLSVGSLGHFFGTPGAREHALALDTVDAAETFRVELLKAVARVNSQQPENASDDQVHLVIVGGGATGVELAAELRDAGNLLAGYGLTRFDARNDLVITVVEGGPRLLGPLPEKVSLAARESLNRRGVTVETDCRVAEVTPTHVVTNDGRRLRSDLCVWAAGISAPAWLAELGLPTNKAGQLEVDACLRTPDPHIFAMGDCAAAPRTGGEGIVPARAQAAHQQAEYLAQRIGQMLNGKTPDDTPFRYREHGSLVSLGTSSGVGSLMGGLRDGNLFVSGGLARLMYMSLHLMHHKVILGVGRTISVALGRLLLRRAHPRVKLH